MNVVPELRESLVKAAARQAAAPRSAPLRRRWLPSPAALAMTFATATALIVAGVILVLAGQRHGSPVPAAVSRRATALTAAERLADRFVPPAGAVSVASDPSRPRRLGRPNDGLPDPTAADVTRFWLVRGGVQAVIAAIGKRTPNSSGVIESEASASAAASSGPNGTTVVTYGSTTYDLSPVGSVNRQIQVSAAPARRGVTAVRLDAIAWWLPPRPAWAQVPPLAKVITIDVLGDLGRAHPPLRASRAIYDEPALGQVLHFLNALPLATGAVPQCGRSQLSFLLSFGPSGTTALVQPSCGLVTVSTPGHPPVRLSLAPLPANLKPADVARFYEVIGSAVFQIRASSGPGYSGSAGSSSATQTMTATASSSTPSP